MFYYAPGGESSGGEEVRGEMPGWDDWLSGLVLVLIGALAMLLGGCDGYSSDGEYWRNGKALVCYR